MNCEISKDLIPLYLDGCCSDESRKIVEQHLNQCDSCKSTLKDMQTPVTQAVKAEKPIVKFKKINIWLASILQSFVFFLSFLAITVGVAFEAATPLGDDNGYWAFMLVVPVTGFMISLANWYFIRIYKNKLIFSICTTIATFLCITAAFIWATVHYGVLLGWLNITLDITLCIASFVLSAVYAKLLGKE